MQLKAVKFLVAFAGGLLLSPLILPLSFAPAYAQSQGTEKKSEQPPTAEEKAREAQQREAQARAMRELEEASKLPKGAGQPECLWLGRRVTSLLWRDDPDAAKRFLDLYDRWGCPGEHVKLAFRCLVRLGPIDQKAQQKLAERVHQCWVHPDNKR